MLVTDDPRVEAKLTLNQSREFDKISIGDDNLVYLLKKGTSEFMLSRSPYSKLEKSPIDPPKNIVLNEVFPLYIKGKSTLMGSGILRAHFKGSDFSFPEGRFGTSWKARILSCAVSQTKDSSDNYFLNVCLCASL